MENEFVDSNWCPDCGEPRGVCECEQSRCDNCNGTGYVREGYDGESPCEWCNHDNFVNWLREQCRIAEAEKDMLRIAVGKHNQEKDRYNADYQSLEEKFSAMRDRAEVAEARLSLTQKNAERILQVLSNLLEACYQADEAGELYESIDGSLLDAAKDVLDTANMIEKQTK